MDSIHYVNQGAIEALGFVPGSMNLIDSRQQEQIAKAAAPVRITAGGSCANTLRGVAFMNSQFQGSIRCMYTGSIGYDTRGERFESILRECHVVSRLKKNPEATGTSTILVTPDGQRTMFTQLGACRDFGISDLHIDELRRADVLYFTGFMWDTPNQKAAVLTAIHAAQDAGIQVIIDIADPFVADRYRADLLEAVREYADYAFCNEQELRSLLQQNESSREDLFLAAAEIPVTWLVKVGAEGCFVIEQRYKARYFPAISVAPVDTTGAGDAFAAGFLFRYLNGRDVDEAAAAANRLAAAIVQIEGCVYTDIPDATLRGFPESIGDQSAE
ncbi:MAG: adenosine kinase [Spirochaeta sp.]